MIVEAEKYTLLNEDELERFKDSELEFKELKDILKRAGYSDKDIAEKIIKYMQEQNEEYKEEIKKLEQEKIRNTCAEDVKIKTSNLPTGYNSERILKYEKSIQKSIFQNLALLKRLQSCQ